MIYAETVLEFDNIKEKLIEYTYTEEAAYEAKGLTPMLSVREVEGKIRETSEAKVMIEKMGNPPLTSLDEAAQFIQMAEKGACLTGEQIEKTASVLTAIRRLRDYLNQCKQLELSLAYYEENLDDLPLVREEIHQSVRGGKVEDGASPLLKSLRRDCERMETKRREKAEAALRTNKKYLSEQFCTERSGHICIPVKKEYKLQVSGSVIDQSATGSTLFIEPSAVAGYAEELFLLRLEEENEVRRILYTLTAALADHAEVFQQNKKTVEKLDFIFAKAKLSLDYDGREPQMVTDRCIRIKEGRHPLMAKETCVPLDFEIGGGVNGVVITGPNTGGKTVAIKTVGLNCMMAQSGLHVSCREAVICMNSQILCDIGDGQNISENLSTFSAHITNVLAILKKVNKESLVIMDELGSGTDPTEGMGIAIAILEELRKSGALFLVTTHYPEVKTYAAKSSGVVNARMAFDRQSLKPLYRLEVGEAGESCALYIAKRLGMPGIMLKRAAEAAYGTGTGLTFELDETQKLEKESSVRLKKDPRKRGKINNTEQYKLGDSVMIYPERKIAIVCEKVNDKGVLRVQLHQKKIWINQKRVKLHVAASELYPEDYDFSIIFDSVEVRKARHNMERKYVEGAMEIDTKM